MPGLPALADQALMSTSMAAAIAAGLSGILNELLGALHGVRDDLCLGLLALLADFLADDAKCRGILTDFHGNSPHFARSMTENYLFRVMSGQSP